MGSHLKVIREKCSPALHILDRFLIVAKMNSLDEVRAEEARRTRREGRAQVLRKSRWLLPLAARISLTSSTSDCATSSAEDRPRDLLKEAFQQLWDNSPAWAGKLLDEWCRQTMPPASSQCTRSPAPHASTGIDPQLLLGTRIDFQRCCGGLNNKARVTMRKSYGFRTYRGLELALYHSLGKLPGPN
jgi:hypothetical protein